MEVKMDFKDCPLLEEKPSHPRRMRLNRNVTKITEKPTRGTYFSCLQFWELIER
jgi:hypothetical protein